MNRLAPLTVLTIATAVLVSGCTGEQTDAGEGSPLLVYSGRNENLVDPVLADLEEAVGIQVEVRYASSSELAAQLLEEGERTEADLFFSQDAGALGALAKADLLAELDPELLDQVPAEYRDQEGRWVATSGRARVLAYDPRQVDATTWDAIDQILSPELASSIGFAPTNASFHAFVTALRVDRGEAAARAWLQDFAALDPQAYENNTAVLEAVDRGEVAVGLINHYYWYQKVAEEGEINARIHFLGSDDPGALVNVAGVGVLATSDQRDAAEQAVAYLLSEAAQQYFADTTAEYPVVAGVTSKHDLPPLTDRHHIDLNDLDSLPQTLALLEEVGLI